MCIFFYRWISSFPSSILVLKVMEQKHCCLIKAKLRIFFFSQAPVWWDFFLLSHSIVIFVISIVLFWKEQPHNAFDFLTFGILKILKKIACKYLLFCKNCGTYIVLCVDDKTANYHCKMDSSSIEIISGL